MKRETELVLETGKVWQWLILQFWLTNIWCWKVIEESNASGREQSLILQRKGRFYIMLPGMRQFATGEERQSLFLLGGNRVWHWRGIAEWIVKKGDRDQPCRGIAKPRTWVALQGQMFPKGQQTLILRRDDKVDAGEEQQQSLQLPRGSRIWSWRRMP